MTYSTNETNSMTLHNDTITGYKVFEADFTCRDYNFKSVGTTHTFEGTPVLCKSGFHFCTTLEDCFKYYSITPDMIVCEVQATDYTDAKDDCSKRTCKTLTIIRQLTLDEIKSHISNSLNAYRWAKNIGDVEDMKQYVTDSESAYYWAKYIGDKEHMKQYVTNNYYAYLWAKYIGDKEYMKQYVTDSEYAYRWAEDIGDEEHMKQYITDSQYAYYWVKNIGDKAYMINKFPELAKWFA